LKREIKEKDHKDWVVEKSIEFPTLMGKILTVNRIKYNGKFAKKENPKRCVSITKNKKSVAWDIELSAAVAAAVRQLSKDFIPAGAQ